MNNGQKTVQPNGNLYSLCKIEVFSKIVYGISFVAWGKILELEFQTFETDLGNFDIYNFLSNLLILFNATVLLLLTQRAKDKVSEMVTPESGLEVFQAVTFQLSLKQILNYVVFRNVPKINLMHPNYALINNMKIADGDPDRPDDSGYFTVCSTGEDGFSFFNFYLVLSVYLNKIYLDLQLILPVRQVYVNKRLFELQNTVGEI